MQVNCPRLVCLVVTVPLVSQRWVVKWPSCWNVLLSVIIRMRFFCGTHLVSLMLQIMLAILIALLTILTWHFTTVYTTKSIKTLAFSLRTELLNRPIARMWNLLNSTVETTRGQVNLSEFVVGQYSLPINTTAQIAVMILVSNLFIFYFCLLTVS